MTVSTGTSFQVETFKRAYGTLPRPMFDTQVAAAMASIGSGLGYQALVEKLLGVQGIDRDIGGLPRLDNQLERGRFVRSGRDGVDLPS